MIKKEIRINNPTGLHTRPGNQFVKLAKTFTSDITIQKDSNLFNGKSLVKLMKAGISQGDMITLNCEGEDEVCAAEALEKYIAGLEE
ncbi:phosphocarrier protein HPr [Alkalispirochaeta americana]|uniref:Phosphocarrier protein HPr n=1 Tax=Alkalispirochaeta americana TaxID=159291 RepID=A0A1N6XQH1_9SPIO|nr:HPr family phosphocarrier protein [Alkalispirochaeta americana]SIR04567.1 phosphocarrier protein HPr [Alkalispirochaeta americana]